MDTDVLVVGAGPTGLMLAIQLGRRGVRTTIIDRHSGPAQQTRAIGVQARTLEIYAKLGLAERAHDLGVRATGANMWASGRWAARIPVSDIGSGVSRFPYILMLGQDDNERIMCERLHDWGIEVQWNTELVGFEQHSERVDATLRDSAGTTRTISAAYMAGCDGSRSTVREMSGIKFPGAPYEHVFFVADTEATGSMKPDEVNVYLWRDGFHLFFPMRGTNHWRVIGILPSALRDKTDISFDDVIPSLQGEAGSTLTFQSCSWFSTYRISHRAAERFRDRRCFVLGDAAHIHSPMGAQGMNTGLQDAYNLAWKLALVLQGRAEDALLDTYQIERLPVAQRLLRTTDRAFRFVVAESWWSSLLRTKIIARVAAVAMTREKVRKIAFRTISQIGIRYPRSPLSQNLPGLPDSSPVAGDRFPWARLAMREDGAVQDLFEVLDDTRFNLLLIEQPGPVEDTMDFGGLVRTHVIAVGPWNAEALDRAHIPSPASYLLRPDGHIALAGRRLVRADIAAWFARHTKTQSPVIPSQGTELAA